MQSTADTQLLHGDTVAKAEGWGVCERSTYRQWPGNRPGLTRVRAGTPGHLSGILVFQGSDGVKVSEERLRAEPCAAAKQLLALNYEKINCDFFPPFEYCDCNSIYNNISFILIQYKLKLYRL